jgi:hypothetical protein
VALLFTAASSGVVVRGLGTSRATPGPLASAGPGGVPAAVFDDRLFDGSTVVPGEPLEITVAASNPAPTGTAPVWLVLEWRPSDADPWQLADGTLLTCVPDDCISRDDPDAHTTVIRWPGLGPGTDTTYQVTVQVTGIEPGGTLRYHVTAGSGSRPDALDAGSTWTLDLAVEAPQ